MLDRSSETLDTIGAAIGRVAHDDWQRVRLKITAAAELVETGVVVEMVDGSMDTSLILERPAHKACRRLRSEMAQPGTGAWYNAGIVLERSTNAIEAEFDYDERPFDGDATDELLLEDQDLFPRDADHLPGWHPARKA